MLLYAKTQEDVNVSKIQTDLVEKIYGNKQRRVTSENSAMKKVFDTLDLAANSTDSVLIEGEDGTGKEFFSATIHYNGIRKDKMFIMQNCSALSSALLNSELFGNEKGALDGSTSEKKGLSEFANGGTLFLGEIEALDDTVQEKLLQMLESGTYYAVGGTKEKKVDVRIIASAGKELKKQVEKGLFSKDLYTKISAIHITLPIISMRKNIS